MMVQDWKCIDKSHDCWRIVGHSIERRIEATILDNDFCLHIPKGFEIDKEALSYRNPILIDETAPYSTLAPGETAVGFYIQVEGGRKFLASYTLPIRKKKKCGCDK